MCRYCDMLKDNDGTFRSTTNYLGFTPLPVPEQQEEKTPEIDLSGLSEEARDVVGLIRCNARMGFADTLDRAHIFPCCLRHGVTKSDEIKRVLALTEQIKTIEVSNKQNNISLFVNALIKAILES